MSSTPPSPIGAPPPYTESTTLKQHPAVAVPTTLTIATPLPSYTSSPVLRATPTTPPPFTPFKLTPPPTTTATRTIVATRENRRVARTLASLAIATLGPTAVDALYLALLNFGGVLLTLLQLPLALVLALEFQCGYIFAEGRSWKERGEAMKKKSARRGEEEAGIVLHFTQLMWDCHDWLEEAELQVPSRWAT